MIQTILITFQQLKKSNQFHCNYHRIKQRKRSLNAVDRISRRLKRTQERYQLLLTQEKCKNESITIEEQDENNVIDELKPKNCALEEQTDYLKNQLQSLQKRNETLEYAKRNYKQGIEELKGERKKLLKLGNDCQSETNN